ncbi:MAG: HD domain-containing protein [Planctomycetota bacterium]
MNDERRAIDFLMEANALDQVPRAGFVMSGVAHPENVAAHTAGMAVACLLIADRTEEAVDRGRLLTMALLHDIGESRTGDVPLVAKTDADRCAEAAAVADMLDGMPAEYAAVLAEYEALETVEARIVKAADKLQMMAKILAYEADGDGDLGAFWENGRNFHDAGLPAARALFDEIRARRAT